MHLHHECDTVEQNQLKKKLAWGYDFCSKSNSVSGDTYIFKTSQLIPCISSP